MSGALTRGGKMEKTERKMPHEAQPHGDTATGGTQPWGSGRSHGKGHTVTGRHTATGNTAMGGWTQPQKGTQPREDAQPQGTQPWGEHSHAVNLILKDKLI